MGQDGQAAPTNLSQRYCAIRKESEGDGDGDLIIYDREADRAWVQSNAVIELSEVR